MKLKRSLNPCSFILPLYSRSLRKKLLVKVRVPDKITRSELVAIEVSLDFLFEVQL